jgi:hypothetical protein
VFSFDGGYEAWAAMENAKAKSLIPASVALSKELQAFLAEHGFTPNDIKSANND